MVRNFFSLSYRCFRKCVGLRKRARDTCTHTHTLIYVEERGRLLNFLFNLIANIAKIPRTFAFNIRDRSPTRFAQGMTL
jgi:hypothetical protein